MRASLALFTVFIAAGASHASGQGRAIGPNELTASEKSAGWRLLFDGKTFKGWRGLGYDSVPTAHWKIADGAIERPLLISPATRSASRSYASPDGPMVTLRWTPPSEKGAGTWRAAHCGAGAAEAGSAAVDASWLGAAALRSCLARADRLSR